MFAADPKKSVAQKKPTRLGQHELSKFEDWSNELVPPSLPLWQLALSAVDISRPTAKNEAVWKYWFPEAKLIFGCKQPHRLLRYLQNWLRLRELWISLADRTAVDGVRVRPLRNQEWRDYLNGPQQHSPEQDTVPEKNGAPPNHFVCNLVRDALHRDVADASVPTSWYGRSLFFLSDTTALPTDKCDIETVRWVAWELQELAFRFEFAELDLVMAPLHPTDFTAIRERQSLLSFVFPSVEDLVAQRSCGLTGAIARDRAPFLDALCRLLSQWPAGSGLLQPGASFTSTSSVMLYDNMERILVGFYCQTFFETCGRPPVLPRQLPVSTWSSLSLSAAASSSILH